MNDFLLIFLSIVLICLPIWVATRKSKEEKAYEKYLEDSLEDETIYEPETGAKITLEQAEKGHWINHDNEYRTLPEDEINKFYSEEEKEAFRALNYLKKESKYKKTDFTEEEVIILDHSKILKKYDEWSYGYVFNLNYGNGKVFLPTVELFANGYRDGNYKETQLMFWIKTEYDLGHYFLREKIISDKILDFIRNDDELVLENYESYTFKKSNNLLYINQLIKSFEGTLGLEIELFENNIFIKTIQLVNIKDILSLEKIIHNIYKT